MNLGHARLASSRRPGFDFTERVADLCLDIVRRHPAFSHVDMQRVSVCFCQARKPVSHGLQASLTPLRFEGGAATTIRRGRRMTVQRVLDAAGREMLYLLSFYLPRFMDLPFTEKLTTIFHELWHIGPRFDGDLRRHAGRCHVHTSSHAQYDAEMARMASEWLALGPDPALFEFLRLDFKTLAQRHGGIYGRRVVRPKLIPVAEDR